MTPPHHAQMSVYTRAYSGYVVRGSVWCRMKLIIYILIRRNDRRNPTQNFHFSSTQWFRNWIVCSNKHLHLVPREIKRHKKPFGRSTLSTESYSTLELITVEGWVNIIKNFVRVVDPGVVGFIDAWLRIIFTRHCGKGLLRLFYPTKDNWTD